jgi:hypothetical protein
MDRFHQTISALVVLFLAGCGGNALDTKLDDKIPEPARTALQEAEQFELLSLDPRRRQEKPTSHFHGWKVLGKTLIADGPTRKKLLLALNKGVKENEGMVAACFNPRHGIRVTHQGKTIDFVICFECFQVDMYVAEKKEKGFLTTGSPQPAFDEALRAANIPLAEKGKD